MLDDSSDVVIQHAVTLVIDCFNDVSLSENQRDVSISHFVVICGLPIRIKLSLQKTSRSTKVSLLGKRRWSFNQGSD